jgi:hypothetical protein
VIKNEKKDESSPALAVAASLELLLWMVEERALVAAGPYCVCGPRDEEGHGCYTTI